METTKLDGRKYPVISSRGTYAKMPKESELANMEDFGKNKGKDEKKNE